jgi:hypothetical protein
VLIMNDLPLTAQGIEAVMVGVVDERRDVPKRKSKLSPDQDLAKPEQLFAPV